MVYAGNIKHEAEIHPQRDHNPLQSAMQAHAHLRIFHSEAVWFSKGIWNPYDLNCSSIASNVRHMAPNLQAILTHGYI